MDGLRTRTREVVLDNTYLTRTSRSYVVETSARYGVAARCIWLDTPLAQAQVNLVERLLDPVRRPPGAGGTEDRGTLRAGTSRADAADAGVPPFEPPTEDEGFASVERVPFERAAHPDRLATGVFVAAVAGRTAEWERALAAAEPTAPHLIFDWSPDGASARLEASGLRCRGNSVWSGGSGALPARRWTADLLVPTTASRSRARVRTTARGRSGAARTSSAQARRMRLSRRRSVPGLSSSSGSLESAPRPAGTRGAITHPMPTAATSTQASSVSHDRAT